MSTSRLTRRRVLQGLVTGAAAVPYFFATGQKVLAADFKLPELPWPRDSLQPHISKETIDYHYGKHHAAYVTNLNKLVPGTPYENMTLEEIIQKAKPGPIFNNAAQIWNHTFYWNSISPKGGGEPEGKLADAINESFGSFAKFKEKFTDAAVKLFGSGWTWLVRTEDGKLAIIPTSNALIPVQKGMKPLLTCDVWEHAYYIDYRNARPKYVEAFWKVVNWQHAATI
jgi:superoxide dismutase, Fe-Mn family